jgi:hypothetical protein
MEFYTSEAKIFAEVVKALQDQAVEFETKRDEWKLIIIIL